MPNQKQRAGNAGRQLFLAGLCVGLLAGCGESSDSSAVSGSSGGAMGSADVIGTVTGTVGDTESEWYAIKMEHNGETASTANYFKPMANMLSYSIQGHAEKRFSIADSVSIELTYMGDSLMAAEMTYFAEEGMLPHYTSEEESVSITIDSLEESGEIRRVTGTARGELYKVTTFTSGTDRDDSIAVDLSFTADLYPETIE